MSVSNVCERAQPRARRWLTWFLGAVVLVAGLLQLSGAPASAHALVSSTLPADGAVLDEAPLDVSLTFNEGIQVPTAGVRVYDRTGTRVDLADASVAPGDDKTVRAGLEPGLPPGTYVVTWRAVSADGHPVKGAWLFSVGEGGEIGDDLVAALFADGGDRWLAVAAVAVRGVATGATLLVAGLGIFGVVVLRRGRRERPSLPTTAEEDASLVSLGRRAAGVALGATVLGVPLQAMLETGLGLGALAPQPLGDVLGSPVGGSALLRAVLLGMLVGLSGRQTPVAPRWPVGLGVGAALTWALEGHSLTQAPIAVMLVGDVVHVLAAAAWLGGLVALALLVRGRRRADDPVGAAALVADFSRLATWSLLALVLAGSAMGWVTVRALRALTSTDYGVTLLVKLALVGLLVLVGLYNRRRLVPAVAGAVSPPEGVDPGLATRIADGGWLRLRKTLTLEVAIIALVVGATGILVGQQPASQEAGVTGAYSTYVPLSDDLEVNLVVDPNRAGLNEIHVYVLDRQGRPVDADSVTFLLEQPELGIGPLDRVPQIAGRGHWSLAGRELAVPGEWRITVVVRTGQFSQEQVTIPVVVNR